MCLVRHAAGILLQKHFLPFFESNFLRGDSILSQLEARAGSLPYPLARGVPPMDRPHPLSTILMDPEISRT